MNLLDSEMNNDNMNNGENKDDIDDEDNEGYGIHSENNNDIIITGYLVESSEHIISNNSNQNKNDKVNTIPLMIISDKKNNNLPPPHIDKEKNILKIDSESQINIDEQQFIENNNCKCYMCCIGDQIKRKNICGMNRIIPSLFFSLTFIAHDVLNYLFLVPYEKFEYVFLGMIGVSGLSFISLILGSICTKAFFIFFSFGGLFIDFIFQIIFNAFAIIFCNINQIQFNKKFFFYISYGAEIFNLYGPIAVYKYYLVIQYDKILSNKQNMNITNKSFIDNKDLDI